MPKNKSFTPKPIPRPAQSPAEAGGTAPDSSGQPAPPPAAENAAPQARPKKIRTGPGCLSRTIGVLGIIILVSLIFAFIGGLKFSNEFLAPEEISREIVVSIPEGAGAPRIGRILEEAGVIKSVTAFNWAMKIKARLNKGKPVLLKAGEMALDPSLPVWKVIDLVAKGNYKLYPFTVPEGRNMFEIAKMVAAAGLGAEDEFLALCRDQSFINSLGLSEDTLEGYLFPETYNFPRGTPLKAIIKTMTDSFFKVWNKYDSPAKEAGLTRHEAVTLASIVEKETGAAPERPVIAGVFHNRLKKGMRLQTDPTVVYGLKNFNGNITRADLAADHPYNTYIIPALPPGPITNPGEAAIAAAVKPASVQYLYFVAKNDGTHQFSITLNEHNRAVRQYQRGGK